MTGLLLSYKSSKYQVNNRSIRPEVFCDKAILKNRKFTGEKFELFTLVL